MPEEATKDAIEADVHVIGISSLAAGRQTLVPQLMEALKREGGGDIWRHPAPGLRRAGSGRRGGDIRAGDEYSGGGRACAGADTGEKRVASSGGILFRSLPGTESLPRYGMRGRLKSAVPLGEYWLRSDLGYQQAH